MCLEPIASLLMIVQKQNSLQPFNLVFDTLHKPWHLPCAGNVLDAVNSTFCSMRFLSRRLSRRSMSIALNVNCVHRSI